MKTKLLKMALCAVVAALPIGAWAEEWSYDFYDYCRTKTQSKTDKIAEGGNSQTDPTLAESASFRVNARDYYNITTPVVNTNLGIVSGKWKLSNVFNSNYETSGQRIGLLATGNDARMAFQNLTAGQTITIEGTGTPAIDGDVSLKLLSTTSSAKTGVIYGTNSSRTFNYNTYVYGVVAAGYGILNFSGGNMVYSVSVSNDLHVTYSTSKSWDLSSMTIPYADGGTTANEGVWFYARNGDTEPAVYYNDRVDNGTNFTDEELYYYANADDKTAGTPTKFAPTEGLKFTTNNSGYSIRLYSNRVYISRGGVIVKIPGLTKGQKLTIKMQAGAVGRGFTTTGLNETSLNASYVNTWEEKVAYVTASGDVTLTSSDGNISIQSIKVETPSYSYAVKIQDIEWASLYLPFDAEIPEGVTAYYAKTANSSTISLKEIEIGIPENQGVVINGTPGIYVFTSASNVDEISTNLFAGVAEETELTDNDNYVLGGSTNEKANPVFNLYASGEGTITLGAYKAYLPKANVPGVSAREITFSFEDGATGINATLMGNKMVTNEVYNLNGQRVAQPMKGLYIVNGKKVVIK
ncbi:MAG: hypothetical protein IJ200_05435 [Prevotella sp.]|nr:hypothetical protein [Prevotella sp.]